MGAVGAGPGVPASFGLLDGIRATGHPWIQEDVRTRFGVELLTQPVIRSVRIVTARDITPDGHHFAMLNVVPGNGGICLRINSISEARPIRDIHVWMPDHADAILLRVDFLANQSSAVITMRPINDTLDEDDEDPFFVLLGDPSYSIGAIGSSLVSILDND